jgi:hypothetical protein
MILLVADVSGEMRFSSKILPRVGTVVVVAENSFGGAGCLLASLVRGGSFEFWR